MDRFSVAVHESHICAYAKAVKISCHVRCPCRYTAHNGIIRFGQAPQRRNGRKVLAEVAEVAEDAVEGSLRCVQIVAVEARVRRGDEKACFCGTKRHVGRRREQVAACNKDHARGRRFARTVERFNVGAVIGQFVQRVAQALGIGVFGAPDPVRIHDRRFLDLGQRKQVGAVSGCHHCVSRVHADMDIDGGQIGFNFRIFVGDVCEREGGRAHKRYKCEENIFHLQSFSVGLSCKERLVHWARTVCSYRNSVN